MLKLERARRMVESCLPRQKRAAAGFTLLECGLRTSGQLETFRQKLFRLVEEQGEPLYRNKFLLTPGMLLADVVALLVSSTRVQVDRLQFSRISGNSGSGAPKDLWSGEGPPRRFIAYEPAPAPSDGATGFSHRSPVKDPKATPPGRVRTSRSGHAVTKRSAPRKGIRQSPARATATDVEVRATPHIEFAGEPARRTPQMYPMELYLDQGPPDDSSETERVQFQVPAGMKTCKIDVSVACSRHFAVRKLPTSPSLTLNIASGTSGRLAFQLEVLPLEKAAAAEAEPRFVAAYFTRKGRPCGKVMRRLHVVDGKLQWMKSQRKAASRRGLKKQTPPTPEPLPAFTLPNSNEPASVVAEANAVAADLRVTVLSRSLTDKRFYTLRCEFEDASLVEDWELPAETREFVQARTDRFMDPEDRGALASLRSTGKMYWRVVPPASQQFIKNALAKGAKTLFVLSEEPWIPWELMILDADAEEEAMPLGALLATGRWVTGDHLAPPQHIPMSSIYLVSPWDSNLENAIEEVAYFETDLQSRVTVKKPNMPVTLKTLDDGLPVAACDALHFICHGEQQKTLQLLKLDDETDLDCSQVTDLKGFRSAFKLRPFVFLNACEVGGVVPSLDGVTGFANAFIKMKASAVVAPLWAVRDAAAPQITKGFYEAVLAGKPFGETVRVIRQQAYTQAGDRDTYAAYCFYGDPLARLEAAVGLPGSNGVQPVRERVKGKR